MTPDPSGPLRPQELEQACHVCLAMRAAGAPGQYQCERCAKNDLARLRGEAARLQGVLDQIEVVIKDMRLGTGQTYERIRDILRAALPAAEERPVAPREVKR